MQCYRISQAIIKCYPMEKNTTPFHPFIPDADSSELPRLFTCPFHYEPHPLSVRAAEEVRRYLTLRTDWKTELDKGKMFGVLVVQRRKDGLFSGLFRYTLRTQRPRLFRTARFRPVATGRFFQDRRSANIPNKPPYRSVGTQRLACLAASTGCR